MKRLSLLFLYLLLCCFCMLSCKNILNNEILQNTNFSSESEFIIPKNTKLKLKDSRPACYGVFEQDGTHIKNFNSLYTAIDYLINQQEPEAYITKTKEIDRNKKLFVYSSNRENMYFFQDGICLDDVVPQETFFLDDLYFKPNIIAVSDKSPNNIMHSFTISQGQDFDLLSLIDFSQDAFLISKAQDGITMFSYNIELSGVRLYPSLNLSQPVYFKTGYKIPADNGILEFGLVCDTRTGNWYYYDGGNEYDEDACVLTSHWNREKRYFTPEEDVVMTYETKFTDGKSVNTLTCTFSSGREYVFDLTANTSVNDTKAYFFAGLDIQSEQSVPDYMNGAGVQNLKISKAIGYKIKEGGDYQKINLTDSGQVKTLLYNTAVLNADYSNKDFAVYNFSYDFDHDQSAYSKELIAVQNLIDGLKDGNEITIEDKDNIKTVQKEYEKLSDYQKKLINAQKLFDAKNAYIELFDGYEKVIAVSDSLKAFLDSDKDYVLNNADAVFDAWDIYNNRLTQEQQDKVSEPKIARLSAYYNQAFGLRLQAENAIIAIDSLSSYCTPKEILSVYEKYLDLGDEQIKRILGEERSNKLSTLVKKINPKVVELIKKIKQLGYAEPADYAIYYGINNFNIMTEVIKSYKALTRLQADMLPKKSRQIYKTASDYFNKQIRYIRQLKEGITLLKADSETYKDDVLKLIEIYNLLDVSSKWHFQNDCVFQYSGYYEILKAAAIELDMTL